MPPPLASSPLRPRPLSLLKSQNREPRSLFIFFPNSLCANPNSLVTAWWTTRRIHDGWCRRDEERNCGGWTRVSGVCSRDCCWRCSSSLLQWRMRLRCCHGGRKSGSMCKGGARTGVAVEMMVVMLRLQWLWWQREDEL